MNDEAQLNQSMDEFIENILKNGKFQDLFPDKFIRSAYWFVIRTVKCNTARKEDTCFLMSLPIVLLNFTEWRTDKHAFIMKELCYFN